MDTCPYVSQVLHQFAQYWVLHRKPCFLAYLRETFEIAPLNLPHFDCLYIAQAKEGDPIQGWIGGLILQWWVVDDEGALPIVKPELPRQPDAPENLRSGFFPRPVMKFYLSGSQITTGEAFGTDYVCRKTARLVMSEGGGIQFVDTRILWNSVSIRRSQERRNGS